MTGGVQSAVGAIFPAFEVKHFTGERGRSGRIMKLRITQENEQVAKALKKGLLNT